MANYNRSMKKAPRDEELLLLVPTRDPEEPIAVEIGWWDKKSKRWEGDWRHDESESSWAQADPFAWAEIPDIDVGVPEPSPRTAPGKSSGVVMVTAKRAAGAKAKPTQSRAAP